MEYRQICGLDKKVSRLVQGTIMLYPEKQAEANRLLDDVFSLGVNCFDSAWAYNDGDSERALGNWMQQRENREDVVVVTKCAHPNKDRRMNRPYDIYSQFEDSLSRLKTPYVDIYLFHRDDMEMPTGPMVEAMNRLIEKGCVRLYGGSNWTAQRIQEANEYAAKYRLAPMAISSPNYGLGEQVRDPWGYDCISLTGEGMAEQRAWYEKTQLPIFAYSSLGRGWFSGRFTADTFPTFRSQLESYCLTAYEDEGNLERLRRCEKMAQEKNIKVPQLAMAYVLQNKTLNLFALLGANNKAEMEDALVAFDTSLTQAEMDWLNLKT